MVKVRIIFLCFSIFLLTHCHITQSFATGFWVDGKDTLLLKSDGNFIYSDYRGYYQKVSGAYDNETDNRFGKWFLTNDCITLIFENETGPDKKTQISYCKRGGQIGRRRIYNHADTVPSNRFNMFTKSSKRTIALGISLN